jgi:hypothetical protein
MEQSKGIALEIGCGHGLPGICLLKRGFETVIFSDFNEEVTSRVLNLQYCFITVFRCSAK